MQCRLFVERKTRALALHFMPLPQKDAQLLPVGCRCHRRGTKQGQNNPAVPCPFETQPSELRASREKDHSTHTHPYNLLCTVVWLLANIQTIMPNRPLVGRLCVHYTGPHIYQSSAVQISLWAAQKCSSNKINFMPPPLNEVWSRSGVVLSS